MKCDENCYLCDETLCSKNRHRCDIFHISLATIILIGVCLFYLIKIYNKV